MFRRKDLNGQGVIKMSIIIKKKKNGFRMTNLEKMNR